MKISLTQYGTEYSVNTNTLVDFNDTESLDDTTCTEAIEAFERVLISAGFHEKSIEKAYIKIME